MISMYTKQEIILGYIKGESQRGISRRLGISRSTVDKYVSEYKYYYAKFGEREQAISRCLSEKPNYKTNVRTPRRLTDQIKAEIDAHLKLNAQKRMSGLGKQILKKQDIYQWLQAKGYQ